MSTGPAPLWRASRASFDAVARLQQELDVPEAMAWALVRRGLDEPGAAREFIAADGPLAPADATPGVREAAARIVTALARRERIVVHGDYDCDGVSSTAILLDELRRRGADAHAFLPSRFTEGYGVAVATVERIAADSCRLLVCVDCGTSAVDALERAVELGMDVVILDHHLAGGRRAPGIIANPALGRPVADLPAAAGVVHAVTRALAEIAPQGVLGPGADAGLDLVALATVADAVPLVGDNRRMVVRGLRAIHEAPRPGIAALCAAAGIEPRTVTARALGFTLAPCINAAGRLAHPDRALELLTAPDIETAQPIAQELWDLNLERREVERAITQEAIAMVEAEPEPIRTAGVVVVAGDGWHEGVVGIVASRLVEHFGRPAIVIARDGVRGKGSGRSVPGVDLHAIVGGAAAPLSRWGGHAGAIGLELPVDRIATFRDELIGVAEAARAAIDRAGVRPVDAVVGCADLNLATAEALEALAPFGRGNPPVRVAVPAVRLEGAQRVGQGKHLQVRLCSGAVNARAIGFQLGARAPGLDMDARHDVVVALEVERWQGVVGPRVGLRALAALASDGDGWAAPEAEGSADRAVFAPELLEDDLTAAPPVAPPSGEPVRGVRDRRDEGVAVATIAALAGADRGVAVVVADVQRRRAALEGVLAPGRLGVEIACVVDSRLHPQAAARRLADIRAASAFVALDYETLAGADLPPGVHLVLLDPPAGPHQALAVRRAAAGRWLHLVWGDDDVDVALAAAHDEWELRPAAAAIWRALRDGGPCAWGPAADRALLGLGVPGRPRPPRIAARALAALCEIGLATADADGVRALEGTGRRDLGEAPTQRACRVRLDEVRAHLALPDPLGPVAPVAEVRSGAVRGIVHA